MCPKAQCYWEASVPLLLAFLALLVKKYFILFMLTVACHGCTGPRATYCFFGDSSKRINFSDSRDCYIHFIYLLQLCRYVPADKYMTCYDLFIVSFYFFPVQGYFQNINLEGTNHHCVWSRLIRTPQVVMEQLLSAKSWENAHESLIQLTG